MQGRIWTVPNQITLLRLGFLPFFLILISYEHYRWALLVLILAALSDACDGLIARKFNQRSSLGAFLDPIADKLLMTAALVVLSLPDHPASFPTFALLNRFPILLTILTISRDVLIVLIALVIHLATGLTRFPPTLYGKNTTVVQVVTVCRSEEHTSELQSQLTISYAVFCLRSEERRVGKECS